MSKGKKRPIHPASDMRILRGLQFSFLVFAILTVNAALWLTFMH